MEARLLGKPGQVVVPAQSGVDESTHGFWKRETPAMFYIQIFNLDAGSYLSNDDRKGSYNGGEGKEVLVPSGWTGA